MKDKLNKLSKIYLIILFCILILVPNIAYFFVTSEKRGNIENRALSNRPVLSVDNVETYPKDYENYYNDVLPFKNFLVNTNSRMKYYLFRMSPAQYVIRGNEGWLFYDSQYKDDYNSMADYLGTNLLSEDEMKEYLDSLLNKREFLKSIGSDFVVFIAPNKSTIYSEFMPSYYEKTEYSRTDQLVDYLKENSDLKIVYPKEELEYYRDNFDYNVYYKTDTHWNELGAYVGYYELMKVIDPNFKNKKLEETKFLAEAYEDGDLAGMIRLNGLLNDTKFEMTDFNTDVKAEIKDIQGDAIKRFTSDVNNGKKLIMYRDSFAMKLLPYLYTEFDESLFMWSSTIFEDQVKREQPDVVVLEVAERYLHNLKR